MNVLQLTINFSPNIGGLETHLDDLVKESAKAGFNTTVLTYNPLTVNTKAPAHEKNSYAEIYRIPWPRNLFYKLVDKPLLEFAYLAPVLTLATPFVVLAKKVDTIHAHGLIAGFAGVITKKILKKRLLISTHAVYNFSGADRFSRFSKFIFSNADHILCLSEDSLIEITNLGINSNNVSTFSNWIDTDTFKPMDIKKPKDFTVLFIGRLVPEKGVRELLEAASLLDKSSNIKIKIAGNGSLDKDVVDMANLLDNLEYMGSLKNTELPHLINSVNAVIVPSTHEEGFGRVAVEALLCNVPVIASKRGGLKDIINEENGIFTETDPRSIAKSISSLASNLNLLNNSIIKASVENRFGNKRALEILKEY